MLLHQITNIMCKNLFFSISSVIIFQLTAKVAGTASGDMFVHVVSAESTGKLQVKVYFTVKFLHAGNILAPVSFIQVLTIVNTLL